MAKVIDITSKLLNEAPKVKIGDKEFQVDNHKNTIIALYEKMNDENASQVNLIDDALGLLLGEEAKKEINEMNLRFTDLNIIFMGILAAATDEEYEDVAARFHDKE